MLLLKQFEQYKQWQQCMMRCYRHLWWHFCLRRIYANFSGTAVWMSGQISPQRGGYASYAIRLMKINGTKLSYFRDVTAWKRSWIKEKNGKKNMEMDDTVMYYIVHLTMGCFVATIECRWEFMSCSFLHFPRWQWINVGGAGYTPTQRWTPKYFGRGGALD